MSALLAIEGLTVSFPAGRARARVIEDVGFAIGHGEIVALVGESGSGKSVTALATMRLLAPTARRESGAIRLDGEDLAALPAEAMRARRGRALAMVFQEPMTSLNPLFRAGFQIGEALEAHLGIPRREARARAIGLMRAVGIPAPERRVDDHPHQLSGGMRQRVMIAIAISCEPRVLVADEPTTALDVTIQAEILELLRELRERDGMALLLITHDLGVVAEQADEVAIMYAGRIVEQAPVTDVFDRPLHPYTQALLRSMPGVAVDRGRLAPVPGTVPDLLHLPSGCAFRDRCPLAIEACAAAVPPLEDKAAGHRAACIRV